MDLDLRSYWRKGEIMFYLICEFTIFFTALICYCLIGAPVG